MIRSFSFDPFVNVNVHGKMEYFPSADRSTLGIRSPNIQNRRLQVATGKPSERWGIYLEPPCHICIYT